MTVADNQSTRQSSGPRADRPLKKAALLTSLLSLCIGATAWLCLALSRGTIPLMQWVPKYALYFGLIPAAGALPILLYALTARVRRMPYVAALVLALIVLLPTGAFTAWFLTGIRAVAEYERPNLIPEQSNQQGSANGAAGIPGAFGNPALPLRKLAFSSDPHFGTDTRNPDATSAILKTVENAGYDAFFVLGDLSETGFPGSGLEEAATALARGLPNVPVATLQGNHDYLIGGSIRYKKIFARSPYWRLDSGTVHVIALDLPWGIEHFGSAQKTWLEKTLASVPEEDFTIVLSHSYFWASGYVDPESGKPWFDQKDMIETVSPILVQGGVDLVLSGHNHYMEYLEAEGISWVIIGAMGGKPDPEPTYRSPASRWFRQGAFGYVDLDMNGLRPSVTFRDPNGLELFRTEVGATRKK